MREGDEESTHVWPGKQRITILLSAMRHFAQALPGSGVALYCEAIGAEHVAPFAAAPNSRLMQAAAVNCA